jgi:hypothetical protein
MPVSRVVYYVARRIETVMNINYNRRIAHKIESWQKPRTECRHPVH